MTDIPGQPVLAGREPRPSPARGLPGRLRRHGDREETQSRSRQGVMEASSGLGEGSLRHSLAVNPQPHTFTHSDPPASEIHSQSSPCLRNSLTVIPLPHTFTHSDPPASENHSQ